MDSAFIYWDNSNIFIGAQYVAMEREGQGARSRVRIHFGHLLELARQDGPSSTRLPSAQCRRSSGMCGIA